MTENLSETIRRQFATHQQDYAEMVYDLLRVAEVTDGLYYSGRYMVLADEVQVYFAEDGVEITFDDWHSDDDSTDFVKIAAPYSPGAVATIVQGLVKLHQVSDGSFTAGTTICCGRPVPTGALAPWRFDGDPAHEGKVYHCSRCGEDTLVDVVEVIASEPATTAGGEQ